MSPRPEDPKVSVVIATYNRSATLRLALQSLLSQDFAGFEAWVVGDACVDNSADAVASFGDPRFHWINLSVNSGSQGEPNNEGLRRARGRYVAFLGHDDLSFPWHLSGLLARIEDTGADLVHSLTALLGPKGNQGIAGPLSPGRTYRDHHVPPSSWLHRKELVDECGPWGLLPAGPPGRCPGASSPRTARGRHRPRQQRHASVPAFRALWSAVRIIPPQLLDAYGRDRWPLAPFLRWRFQRDRLRWRLRRGLPRL